MKPFLKTIWRFFGSMNLTVVLCLMLMADLGCGYLCMRRHTGVFSPLNDIGLWHWLGTYGTASPSVTAWFFLLILLLTLLGINTFVCTTERLLVLGRARKNMPLLRFTLLLAPHIMHYAVILMLSGYLCSYLTSRVIPVKTLLPGRPAVIRELGLTLTMEKLELDYFSGNRMPFFQGYAMDARATLLISDGADFRRATLGINRPVRIAGLGIFLTDFSPRKKNGGMKWASDRVDVTIREDYGVYFYLAGMLLFFIGLVLYVYDILYFKLLKKGTV